MLSGFRHKLIESRQRERQNPIGKLDYAATYREGSNDQNELGKSREVTGMRM